MNIKHFVLPAFLTLASSVALADNCAVTIGGNDAMQFDKKTIVVGKACKKFTVTLNHTGKLAKNVMGHNWVLSKTEDAQAVSTDGMAAGLDKNYLKPDDARVIAATKVIGGGETTSVEVPVSKLTKDGKYTYFCSFPGHVALMKGTLTLE
ncbi:MAG: azurin [Cellvibrio sp.]